MRSFILPLSLLPSALAATVYLAGDSTMASTNGGTTDGMHNPIHLSYFTPYNEPLTSQAGVTTSRTPSPAR